MAVFGSLYFENSLNLNVDYRTNLQSGAGNTYSIKKSYKYFNSLSS